MHTTTSPPIRRTSVIATLLLALGLVAGVAVTPATAQVDTFIDVDDVCPPGVNPGPASFGDRGQISQAHIDSVDCAVALTIVRGEASGNYNPGGSTSRGQMATFIAQALEAAGYDLPSPSNQGFDDISGNIHADNINILAELGIVRGVTTTRFDAETNIRRDQMATFLLQAAEFAFDDPEGLDPTGAVTFSDVPTSSIHARNINASAELLGLTTGVSSTQYAPRRNVTREQMASFVIRLVDVTQVSDPIVPGNRGGSSSQDGLLGPLAGLLGPLLQPVLDLLGLELP